MEPVKSPSDKRSYRFITLPNKLDVLCVSDPDTDKSAASMDVRIGSFAEPDNLLGLAHFCEHMLFLGSKKYPSENEYERYLSEHGGGSNAYTDDEDTNYFFEITKDHLYGALDRFAQFFIEPLFNADSTDREMKAVDSENSKNLNSDYWRLSQVVRTNTNNKHPFSRFSTGNLQTLRDDPKKQGLNVRDELIKWYNAHYSANVMKLCVLGKESLDELEKWCRELFSGIPNKEIKLTEYQEWPMTSDNKAVQQLVVPVKELRQVKLIWPMKSLQEAYEEKPSSYLSHLLGHEGNESLFAALKRKGWIDKLSAGPSNRTRQFEFMTISIDLTEEGFAHRYEVVEYAFQYIELLKRSKPQEWVYNELKNMGEIQFQYLSMQKPMDCVLKLAGDMQVYKPKDIISAPYLHKKFNPELINSVLDQLTPENLVLQFVGKEFKGQTDAVEPWYNAHYKNEKIPADHIQKWKSIKDIDAQMTLPAKNEFIPQQLTLKEVSQPQTEPHLIKESKTVKVWHMIDSTFKRPKANLFMQLTLPAASKSPSDVLKTQLIGMLCQDSLNEYAYYADIAGLDYGIEDNHEGLEITVKGYNEKLPLLIKRVIERLKHLVVKQDRFDVLKKQVRRTLKNFSKNQPHAQARYFLDMSTVTPRCSLKEKLAVIDDITAKDTQEFLSRLLEYVHMEVLVHGNMTRDESLALVEQLEPILNAKPITSYQMTHQRIVKLSHGKEFVYQTKNLNKNDENSAIFNWFEIAPMNNLKKSVLLDLVAEMLSESFFDTLRTKEQLGYIAWSGTRTSQGIAGYRTIVQSTVKDPAGLNGRIENFFALAEKAIKDISKEEFENHVESLKIKKLEKPTKLTEQTKKFWTEISYHHYQFDRRAKEVEILKTVTPADALSFYQKYIKEAKSRRKISIHVYGNKHPMPEKPDESAVAIKDVDQFKQGMSLFPYCT
jgi:insulysin